jgi:iron complex outermembrane receptor protein
MLKRVILCSTLAMACTATAAWAQEPARAPDPGGRASRKLVQLEKVVVTARRREEQLRDVPQAVTAVSGEELESRGAQNIAALGAVTPNLVIYPGRVFNNTVVAYIRGIGQFDSIWGVEPGVGIYLDDVHLARPQGALLDVLDVERVEVLRGPQGTLYGRNTLGGAIKFVTRAPSADFGGRLSLTLGDYGRRDAKAVLNLPLGHDWRTRVALAKYDRDGFGRNLTTGADAGARDAGVARINAVWDGSADVEVRLAYDRTRDRSGPPAARRLEAPSRVDPDHTPLDPGRYDVRSDAPERLDLDNEGASATVDWTLAPDWRLRSITAWRQGESDSVLDMDSLAQPLWMLTRLFSERQTSQEFQLHHDHDDGSLVAGLYLFDGRESGSGHNLTMLPGIFATPYNGADGSLRTRSAAVYADWVRDFNPRWQLDAGLRYTVERKSVTAHNGFYTDDTFMTPTPDPPYFGRPSADFTDSETYRAPTPSLALARRTGHGLLYAKASRGFKGGSYNVRANTVTNPGSAHPLDAETVTAYEFGAKTEWLDGRLSVDATVFRNDYEDIQLSVNILNPPGRPFADFRNAGSGTAQGMELEWRAKLGSRLSWTGHVGYLDAGYDQYIDGGVDVASSRVFPNAPRWTAGTSLVADVPLQAGGALRARVDGRYQSEVRPTTDLSPLLVQPGYALWNASVAWDLPGERWQVALRGDNLADTGYLTSGFEYRFGITTGYYGPPRTVSLTLDYSF